jgi:hypothetical protein
MGDRDYNTFRFGVLQPIWILAFIFYLVGSGSLACSHSELIISETMNLSDN